MYGNESIISNIKSSISENKIFVCLASFENNCFPNDLFLEYSIFENKGGILQMKKRVLNGYIKFRNF
jgi:hypothetical protein